MSRGWLTQRYGQATFMGRWGAALALLAALPVFLLFCQGRGQNPHIPDGMLPFSIACLALLVTVLACVAVLRTLGGPRVSLAEGWLLAAQAGAWTGIWVHAAIWDRLGQPEFLRWVVLSTLLTLGTYAAAAFLHRQRVRSADPGLPRTPWWCLWLAPHAFHAVLLGATAAWLEAEEVNRAWLAGLALVAILYGVFRQQRPPAPTPASEPLRSRAPIRPEARRRSVSAEPIQGGAASGRRRAGRAPDAKGPSG